MTLQKRKDTSSRNADRRQYMRHPSELPIEVGRLASEPSQESPLRDVGTGGLSFVTREWLPPSTIVRLRIPCVTPEFSATARVAWCEQAGTGYRAGVQFLSDAAQFAARMVEQVCQIERYRREMQATSGRTLSAEEAAIEWIQRHAATFPRPERTAKAH